MPLSEGATRARHARRLLQRVLDYAPDGTTIHPIVRIGRHAAEGIIEASAEQEADLDHLRLGRARGRRPRRQRPDGLLADHRRGRPRLPVRHRGRQAAWHQGRSGASSSRSAAGRTPSWRCASPTPSPATTTRPSSSSTSSRPGSRWPSGPRPSAPSRPSSSSTSRAAARPSCARRPTSATRSCARRRRRTSWSWARRRQPGGADGESYLFGALPEAIAARAKPTVMVVKTRETDRAHDLRPAGRPRRDAGRRRPRGRGGTRRPGPGRALVRRIELPPRRVRRPAPAGDAQGEAEADDQPRPADAQRGGDDRADRPPGDARDGRPRAAPRRGPRHRLGVDRPDPRDRRGRGRPRRPASRRAAPLRLVRRQGRGALEVGLRDDRRHHRLGRHGREELAPPDGLRDARAAAPRAAPAVRQGLLPAPDRRGRRAQGGRRRPGHGARRPAAHQPVLPGAVGDDPAAVGRVRRPAVAARGDPVLHRLRRRDRAPDRRRGAARHRRARARSTSSDGSIATRSSKACRGCRSSSSRPS